MYIRYNDIGYSSFYVKDRCSSEIYKTSYYLEIMERVHEFRELHKLRMF